MLPVLVLLGGEPTICMALLTLRVPAVSPNRVAGDEAARVG